MLNHQNKKSKGNTHNKNYNYMTPLSSNKKYIRIS